MSNHDHSKVEVGPTGNIILAVDRNGNPMKGVALNWLQSLTDCPAYGRYIDRRVSHPAEDPRVSARWANDWPASGMTGYVLDASAAAPYTTGGTVMRRAGEGAPPPPKPWPNTAAEVQRVESAQDGYPPVYDRPTFFLCVLIAALAGMLVGIIAGAMVMA